MRREPVLAMFALCNEVFDVLINPRPLHGQPGTKLRSRHSLVSLMKSFQHGPTKRRWHQQSTSMNDQSIINAEMLFDSPEATKDLWQLILLVRETIHDDFEQLLVLLILGSVTPQLSKLEVLRWLPYVT